jgi:hypothetical protein
MPIHRSIPAKDVPMVKGMLLRNDPQQDIAWYVGVNNSRVNELKKQSTPTARRFSNTPPAPPEELPPPGPHPSAREFYELLTVEKMLTEAAIGLAVWQMDVLRKQFIEAITDLNLTAQQEIAQARAETAQALKNGKQAWAAQSKAVAAMRDAKASQKEQREEVEKELKIARNIIEDTFTHMESILEPKPKREKTWVSDRPINGEASPVETTPNNPPSAPSRRR